jgi:chromosome segregation ATPase
MASLQDQLTRAKETLAVQRKEAEHLSNDLIEIRLAHQSCLPLIADLRAQLTARESEVARLKSLLDGVNADLLASQNAAQQAALYHQSESGNLEGRLLAREREIASVREDLGVLRENHSRLRAESDAAAAAADAALHVQQREADARCDELWKKVSTLEAALTGREQIASELQTSLHSVQETLDAEREDRKSTDDRARQQLEGADRQTQAALARIATAVQEAQRLASQAAADKFQAEQTAMVEELGFIRD